MTVDDCTLGGAALTAENSVAVPMCLPICLFVYLSNYAGIAGREFRRSACDGDFSQEPGTLVVRRAFALYLAFFGLLRTLFRRAVFFLGPPSSKQARISREDFRMCLIPV